MFHTICMNPSTTQAVAARPERRSHVARCVGLAFAAALAAVALGLALGGDASERWQLATRFTARVSFPIFLLAFTASSLGRLFPSELTRGLVRVRRGLGLGFALAHTIHLGALVTLFAVSGQRPNLVTVVGGGLTYLFIFGMAATSNDAAVKRLGRNWSRLHTTGAYLVWLIFLQSYAGRVAAGKYFFAPQVILAVSAGALRFAAHRRRRSVTLRAK